MSGRSGRRRGAGTGGGGFECLESRSLLSRGVHGGAAAAAGSAPPTLVESHLQRQGNTITGLVMTFSKPLDPATAQDLGNYAVFPEGPASGADAAVTAAVYDATHDSVTLVLAQPVTILSAPGLFVFTVQGPTIASGTYDTSYTNTGGLPLTVSDLRRLHSSLPVTGITDTSGRFLSSKADRVPDGRLFAQFKAKGSTPNELTSAHINAQQARQSAADKRASHPEGVFSGLLPPD